MRQRSRALTTRWQRMPRGKVDVLIYDGVGEDLLKGVLGERTTAILHVRGESVFVSAALRALIAAARGLGNLKDIYEDVVLNSIRPTVLITFIDNNQRFHRLADRHPEVKSVMVQNGVRGRVGDLFGQSPPSPRPRVDLVCTLGNAVVGEYSKHVDADFHPVGSLKANSYKWSGVPTDDRVVFVSQFRAPPADNVLIRRCDGSEVSFDDFYAVESALLPKVLDWCESRGRRLVVAGASTSREEPEFFRRVIGDRPFEFAPRSDDFSSYDLVSRSSLVVVVDSTLGLEALAFGRRVAFFAARFETLRDDAARFAWPAQIPDSGPFWSSEVSDESVAGVLSWCDGASPVEWSEVRTRIVHEACVPDEGNKLLRALLMTTFDEDSTGTSESHDGSI